MSFFKIFDMGVGSYKSSIQSMLGISAIFVVFFFALLVIFALSYVTFLPMKFYPDINIWKIILILFEVTTANYEFVDKGYGWQLELYHLIFIIVFHMMLLSLFVGILSEIYSKIVTKARPLHLLGAARIREIYKADKKYMFLISSYAGFDVLISIIFLPIFIFLNQFQRKSLNSILLYIEYGLAFILILPLFCLCEIILFPFCYIRMMIEGFIKIKETKSKISSICFALGFILWGPLMLLGIMFLDIKYFIVECFCIKPGRYCPDLDTDFIAITEIKEIRKNALTCPNEINNMEEFVQHIFSNSSISQISAKNFLPFSIRRSSSITPINVTKFSTLIFMKNFIKNNFALNYDKVDRDRFCKILCCFMSSLKISRKTSEQSERIKPMKVYNPLNVTENTTSFRVSNQTLSNIDRKVGYYCFRQFRLYREKKYLKGVTEFFCNSTDSQVRSDQRDPSFNLEKISKALEETIQKIDRIEALYQKLTTQNPEIKEEAK